MKLPGGPIEAHAHRGDPELAKPDDRLSLELGCRARRDRDLDWKAPGVLDQLEEIGALERIASRENEHASELFHLLHQRLAFLGAELARVAMRDGAGAAVLASQVAGDRRLPIDVSRRAFVKEPRVLVAYLPKLAHGGSGLGDAARATTVV